MSLKKNILVNYVSQIYIAIVGIVIVPLYLKYMGAEAYGLVGFFAMSQAFFNLLDMGMTPTMSRETARFRGGATDALSYRRFVRALEGVYLTVALVGSGSMFAAAGYISRYWLQATHLPIVEVQTSVQLMAGIIALRWMCGLYNGAIGGSERLAWLGGYNSFVATLRFVGVLPVLIYIGTTPTIFFSYQLAAAAIEFTGLFYQAYRLLPVIPQGKRLKWSWAPLKPVLKFSLTIAFTTSVWVMVTQLDKLVLSKLLPLAEYGYFTLAVLAANGVMMLSGPITNSIIPRMVRLESEGDHEGLIRTYRQSTQLVTLIVGAASITLAFCAEPLLWAWTGNKGLAHQAAPILVLYSLGNGILSVCGFPSYLQYARGNLRLHLIGNVGFVVLMIPSIIWAASHYGGLGAGYVWLTMMLIDFVVWVPFMHSRLEPGLNKPWILQDILMICLIAALTGYGLIIVMPPTDSRWWQFAEILIMGLFVMLAGALASSFIRAKVRQSLAQRKMKLKGDVCVLMIGLIAALAGYGLYTVMPPTDSRWRQFAEIIIMDWRWCVDLFSHLLENLDSSWLGGK